VELAVKNLVSAGNDRARCGFGCSVASRNKQ
jgi:hypothetical protein